MGTRAPATWVVYKMALTGGLTGRNAVCTQAEWEAMQRTIPGRHALIRGAIGNEGEAERLARDLQMPPDVPKSARRPAFALHPDRSPTS